MTEAEKYGLGDDYQEIEVTGETLYDFLKSIELEHFSFDVYPQEASKGFKCCGLVYKECNDVENLLKKSLSKIECKNVLKAFKFYSTITESDYFRIILKE